jgi:F0F1-type ATP synthase assembly protein I
MLPSSKPPVPNPALSPFSSKAFTVGGEVGCVTLIIVLASVFGGIWLDRLFGTKPVIMLILVLSSAPLSLWLTFWLAKRAVRDLPTSQPTSSKSNYPKSKEEGGEDW